MLFQVDKLPFISVMADFKARANRLSPCSVSAAVVSDELMPEIQLPE